MIGYLNKTVFNSNCDGLVNTVNCVGAMGAGLALEFSLRYPEMKKKYEDDCKSKRVKIGEIITYKEKDCLIVGFPTKLHWKYPSELKWISDGLDYMARHYKEWNIRSIAIPPLGCSNGGLNFELEVKPLIESKLKDIDLDVFICVDPGIAEGKEKLMLDEFNGSDIEELCDYLKIKGRSRDALLVIGNVDRFYMIKDLNNVGFVTYKKLFDYFYNDGTAIRKEKKPSTLFDL